MNLQGMIHEYPLRMGALIGFLIAGILTVFGVW